MPAAPTEKSYYNDLAGKMFGFIPGEMDDLMGRAIVKRKSIKGKGPKTIPVDFVPQEIHEGITGFEMSSPAYNPQLVVTYDATAKAIKVECQDQVSWSVLLLFQKGKVLP